MNYCKKVILTGATGLIGKEIVPILIDNGFDIYALTINGTDSKYDINWIDCNIFDNESIESVFKNIKSTYLLNFAWCTTEDYLYSDLNYKFLESSKKMLMYFKENGGKRVVYAGTCFEYDFKDIPLKETDNVNPQTVYAKCKNDLRIYAQTYCKNNDMSFAWGRIFNAFGRNEFKKRLTPYIINSLLNNNEVVIKNSSLVRDYIYSKDIAKAFCMLLDSKVENIVNICKGEGTTLGEYAMKIAEILNKQELIILKNSNTNEPKYIVGNNSKLINEVKFIPDYTLNDALKDIIYNSKII